MTKDEIIEQYSWLIPSGSRVDFLGAIDALIIHERQKAFVEAAEECSREMARSGVLKPLQRLFDKFIELAKGGGGEH